MRRFATAAERFEAFADTSAGPTACWPWTGHVSPGRYGMITRDDGTKGSAHRYAFESFVGPVPEGMVVKHRCDNKACVNPAHLVAGSQSSNVLEASERGQLPRGSRHHSTSLAEGDIPKIRALLAEGVSEQRIAVQFGVGRGAINHISRGNSWRHVKEHA